MTLFLQREHKEEEWALERDPGCFWIILKFWNYITNNGHDISSLQEKPGSQRISGWCSRRWRKVKRTLETESLVSSYVCCASCLGNLNSLSVCLRPTCEARRVKVDQAKLKMTTDLKRATSSLNEYRSLLLLERIACNNLAHKGIIVFLSVSIYIQA